MSSEVSWVCLARIGEFDETRRIVRDLDGVSILLLKSAGGVIAVRNACTHLGKPLADGRVMAGRIFCPFHGACFDLTTGEAVSGPAVARLQRYEVKIEGDCILVRVTSETARANVGKKTY